MSSVALKVLTQGRVGAPALVFFHAFPFSAEMWREQISLFSENYFCVAVDLPGFGESALPAHAVTFEHYVDAVLAYLKESKIESSVWCGLSMGGYLALRLFERSPEMCSSLILCDTKSGADGNEAKLKRAGAVQAIAKDRAAFNEAQWKALVGESSLANQELKKRFDGLIARVSDAGAAQGAVALATRTETTEGLSEIKVPCLILVGADDKVTPPSEAEAMAQAIAGAKLVIIPKSGHLSNLENPRAFNAALVEFLSAL